MAMKLMRDFAAHVICARHEKLMNIHAETVRHCKTSMQQALDVSFQTDELVRFHGLRVFSLPTNAPDDFDFSESALLNSATSSS